MTLLEFDKRDVPMLPDEFRGNDRASCGYTKSSPREWTEEEMRWIADLRKQGYRLEEIARSVGRTEVAVQIKLKRLGKKNERYNENHREEKYSLNQQFLSLVQPESVLDLYCGTNSWWSTRTKATTNDFDKHISATYNEPAEKLIHKLYYEGCRYDIVDLDPFGSAYECFDLAVKMANKGLIITFGEMGHKRFKRLDYVSRYYGINTLDDFTTENLISEVVRIGKRNKKMLSPVLCGEWNRISRVYLTIEPLKVTEQWENM